MYCNNCGTNNPDNAVQCMKCHAPLQAGAAPQPGYPQQPAGYPQQPGYVPGYATPGVTPGSVPNYMVWSILVTLFCCLPLGIVAIIQSSKVNGLLAQGNYQGAMAASQAAKKYCTIGAIVGGIVTVIWIIVQIAAVSAHH